MTAKLAIQGGPKVRTTPFPFYKTIGQEEIDAVTAVLKSGILSKYIGGHHPDFGGGPQVQAFEKEWGDFFGADHAISVNSASSGLIAALGAIGLGPGDEVIVTPFSMCISATAPLFYGAIPVFADIEPDTFCLDPKSVEARVTDKTKAIIVVDIFGNPYDQEAINAIALKHNLYVIEDASQAPMAKLHGQMAGTLGHIGVHSLNYHKHIHTGEGGMVLTNDATLAERIKLIRNHAEAVVAGRGIEDLTNMLGFNFRMTEMEAAIGRAQLKKLPELVQKRQSNAEYVKEQLEQISFLKVASPRKGAEHVWYVQILLFDEVKAGVSRNVYIDAVKAELMPTENRESEGVHIGVGYALLHQLPIFQKRIAIGKDGFPFTLSDVTYEREICPVAEKLFYKELIIHHLIHPALSRQDLDDVVTAFKKVAENIEELRK